VAIEQRTSRSGRKSTVATMTQIYHFLRLLFVQLGIQYCPDCEIPIESQTSEAILAKVMRDYRGRTVSLLAPLVVARKGYYTDLAKWAKAKGFSDLRVDGELIATETWPRLDRFKEHDIELPVGEITVTPEAEAELRALLDRALVFGKGVVQVVQAHKSDRATKAATSKHSGAIFSIRRACPSCGRSFEELDPRLFSFNSKRGWCKRCYGTGLLLPGFDEKQTGEEIWWNKWWKGQEQVCPACKGRRLRPEALAVRFRGRSIADLTSMSVEEAKQFFQTLELRGREALIARDILAELRSRLGFLKQVGLSYLSLDRSAPTLSGGEAQRIRLASQLGSNLRGVCYILDEPTIGLHARDNRMLLKTLAKLIGKGNTVVVVEHDEETIRRAEYVVDLGPGAGVNGGRVVAEGSVEELLQNPQSVTGRFLASPLRHPLVEKRRLVQADEAPMLDLVGAHLHNLKNLQVNIPLRRLVCVTGVSGSGKSTLVKQVLYENLRCLLQEKRLRGSRLPHSRLYGCGEIKGWNVIQRVLEVDQTPIGKTPRSCPATYLGLWDHIRRLYAGTPEARIRGYGPGRFSFNVKGGRCDECQGQGVKKIKMSFLPDVTVMCEACGGSRFTPETLMIRYKDKSIADVLAMSVDEAAEFFTVHERIHHTLRLLQSIGLGYLTLGQQSPTLSGGEAQRIKLVTELAKARPVTAPPRKRTARHETSNVHSLYVLDEPSIGLHMADVEKLIRVLHRLVAAGNTVVITEHNLDIIAEADWVIDLGPEGGDGGGRIVAQGTPEAIARVRRGSHTAKVLADFLKERVSIERSVCL
jgi:excinuclease ABC subunit A